MAEVWFRVLFVVNWFTAAAFKLEITWPRFDSIDWPYYHEMFGTIIYGFAIITTIFGVLVNRKTIFNQIKSIFKSK